MVTFSNTSNNLIKHHFHSHITLYTLPYMYSSCVLFYLFTLHVNKHRLVQASGHLRAGSCTQQHPVARIPEFTTFTSALGLPLAEPRASICKIKDENRSRR